MTTPAILGHPLRFTGFFVFVFVLFYSKPELLGMEFFPKVPVGILGEYPVSQESGTGTQARAGKSASWLSLQLLLFQPSAELIMPAASGTQFHQGCPLSHVTSSHPFHSSVPSPSVDDPPCSPIFLRLSTQRDSEATVPVP